MLFVRTVAALALSLAALPAAAQEGFTTGPLIKDFGPIAPVMSEVEIPEGTVFTVRWDARNKARTGELNTTLVAAARFLNMHAAAGVKPEDMRLAVVVHGEAVRDVATNETHRAHYDADNANLPLIAELAKHGARIYVCGQSAAYYKLANEGLAPGVAMALSAMTMHALLEDEGYTLINPL